MTHAPRDIVGRFDPVGWWARVDGSRTALIEGSSGARHSYAQLDVSADRWAGLLRDASARPGDRVAVLAPNRLEFIALFFGAVRRGVVLVPLNWRLSSAELGRVLADAEPTVLIGEDRLRSTAEAAVTGAKLVIPPLWIDFDRDAPGMLARAGEGRDAEPARVAQDDAAMLLYTSGSTGAPKGVIIPHRQIHFNAIATATAWQLGSDDIGPAATPFFHTGGWHVFTTPLLARGAAVVLIDSFDANDHLALLDRCGVTVTFGVPTHLAMLREASDWGRPLPRLRWFVSGGAPCPQRIRDDVRAAGYRFREGYGLTECGPNCFATSDATARDLPGSVGWPVPFLETRITRDDGTAAADDEVGELELRGPQLFGGYFRAPEKSAEVMTADGWLRTGDLAARDGRGVHFIRGRRKEMFISGGENVFPGEVEAAVLDCPGVLEVAVIGVPDAKWGEVGCAVVVRRDATLDESTLVQHVRARLAGYKVPRRVRFVDAIPRLGSGKIDRRATAALVADA